MQPASMPAEFLIVTDRTARSLAAAGVDAQRIGMAIDLLVATDDVLGRIDRGECWLSIWDVINDGVQLIAVELRTLDDFRALAAKGARGLDLGQILRHTRKATARASQFASN